MFRGGKSPCFERAKLLHAGHFSPVRSGLAALFQVFRLREQFRSVWGLEKSEKLLIYLENWGACHAGGRGFEARDSRHFWAPCTRIRGRKAMGQLLQTYLPLVIFIGIAFFISGALLLSPFLIAVRRPDPEKVSAYECGFNAFDDARMKFDVRFYLVSLLFIIFDL